jgi:HemY protein
MWRALVFIGLLALAAFGAVWLADHPGTLSVSWQGREYITSLAVGLVSIIVIAMMLSFVWAAIRFMTRLPHRMGEGSRRRRRDRGHAAVSRGMIAIAAGDVATARRYAGEAERLLGNEPLTLLLRAQTAQASADQGTAEAAFRLMLDTSETRVLGLRGLFLEARRRNDAEAAQQIAEEATRIAPAVGWANDAVLEGYSARGDWQAALRAVERRASLGLTDKNASRRQRAVLHAAAAFSKEKGGDVDGALASSQEAVRLAPDLVPAAALAGRLLSRRGDLKRAAKVVETAWKSVQHPDLAAAYLNLRPGDAAADRLRRAETLARLSSWAPESRLAIGRAAIDGRDFARARDVLRPLLDERPTVRVCLMMAELEQAEGHPGRLREWLARAARAPRDKAWIADGIVSDTWAPVSPVTGRLDAFVWDTPPEILGRSPSGEADFLDHAMQDEEMSASVSLPATAAIPASAQPVAPAQPREVQRTDVSAGALDVLSPPAEGLARPATPERKAAPAKPFVAPAPPSATIPLPDEPIPVARRSAGPGSGSPPTAARAGSNGSTSPTSKPTDAVVFPFGHPPDDPGADRRQEKNEAKRSLFGAGS